MATWNLRGSGDSYSFRRSVTVPRFHNRPRTPRRPGKARCTLADGKLRGVPPRKPERIEAGGIQLAGDAIFLSITKALVAIVDERDPAKPSLGSGTLIQHNGSLFVLTAAHNLYDKDGDEYSLISPQDLRFATRTGQHEGKIFAGAATLHPLSMQASDVDVALISVSNALRSELRDFAISSSLVGEPPDGLEKGSLAICGLPFERVMSNEDGNHLNFVLRDNPLESISIAPGEKRLWAVPWGKYTLTRRPSDSKIPAEWIAAYEALFGKLGTEQTKPLHPGGMSGGGAWIVRYQNSNALIWDPTQHCVLTGVQVSWDRKETAYVEPFERWGAWFRDVIEGPWESGDTRLNSTES